MEPASSAHPSLDISRVEAASAEPDSVPGAARRSRYSRARFHLHLVAASHTYLRSLKTWMRLALGGDAAVRALRLPAGDRPPG